MKTSRLDRIEQSINNLTNLAEQMNARFDNLEKDFNKKIDQINTRLDYYGLQIERIEKRLDYNNLKKLPK